MRSNLHHQHPHVSCRVSGNRHRPGTLLILYCAQYSMWHKPRKRADVIKWQSSCVTNASKEQVRCRDVQQRAEAPKRCPACNSRAAS